MYAPNNRRPERDHTTTCRTKRTDQVRGTRSIYLTHTAHSSDLAACSPTHSDLAACSPTHSDLAACAHVHGNAMWQAYHTPSKEGVFMCLQGTTCGPARCVRARVHCVARRARLHVYTLLNGVPPALCLMHVRLRLPLNR